MMRPFGDQSGQNPERRRRGQPVQAGPVDVHDPGRGLEAASGRSRNATRFPVGREPRRARLKPVATGDQVTAVAVEVPRSRGSHDARNPVGSSHRLENNAGDRRATSWVRKCWYPRVVRDLALIAAVAVHHPDLAVSPPHGALVDDRVSRRETICGKRRGSRWRARGVNCLEPRRRWAAPCRWSLCPPTSSPPGKLVSVRKGDPGGRWSRRGMPPGENDRETSGRHQLRRSRPSRMFLHLMCCSSCSRPPMPPGAGEVPDPDQAGAPRPGVARTGNSGLGSTSSAYARAETRISPPRGDGRHVRGDHDV